MRYKLLQQYPTCNEAIGTKVKLKYTTNYNMPYYEGNGYSYTTDEVENFPHLWERLEDEYPTYGEAIHGCKNRYDIEVLETLLHLRDMWWEKDNWKPDWESTRSGVYVFLIENKWETVNLLNAGELFTFKDKATAEKFLEQNREYLEQLKPLFNGL
jgi:hypothetical protein